MIQVRGGRCLRKVIVVTTVKGQVGNITLSAVQACEFEA